jgi:hypothetical protein
MFRWLILLVLLLPGMASLAHGQGRFELQSSRYPVVLYSEDPVAAEKALGVLDGCAARFERVLGVTIPQTIHYVFRLHPPRKGEEPGWSFPVSLMMSNRKSDFIIFAPETGAKGAGAEALARTFFLVLLQSVQVNAQPPKPGATLNDPPFWLLEGLTQCEMPDRHEDFYKIASRLVEKGPMPSLATVQGWTVLSPHRLEQLWQQALCYRLIHMAAMTPADQTGLRTWVNDWMTGAARPYWEDSGETEAWWRQGRGVPSPVQLPVFDWDQTVALLDECLVFRIRMEGDMESHLVPMAKLPQKASTLADGQPVLENIQRMADLQLRAHFVWQPIIQEYRGALSSWTRGDYKGFQRQLNQAVADRAVLQEYIGQVRDYLNWYQVNYPVQGDGRKLLEDAGAFMDYDQIQENSMVSPPSEGTKVNGTAR